MPHSRWSNKKIIARWIKKLALPRERILDLGAGSGTYHLLLTEWPGKFTALLKYSHWIAVEVWEPYIEEFKLREIYDEVYIEDIRTFDYSKVAPIDITFMGDVLEHMTKEEAQEVVAKVLKISKYAVISIPIIKWEQGEVDGNPYEKYIKDDWTHAEVMNSFPHIIENEIDRGVGVYLLEGKVI
jgi:SAM-dependent methyltransferase